MQGHGREAIRLCEQPLHVLLLQKPVGQMLADRPFVMVFELMDQRAERVFVDAQSQDAIEVGDAAPFAEGARRIRQR